MTTPTRTPPETPATTPAELLATFSMVTSAALGLPAEHGVRACYIGVRIGRQLELPADEISDLYYAGLVKDGGCTCGASQMAAFLEGDEMAAMADYGPGVEEDPVRMLRWLFRHAAAGQGPLARARRILDVAVHGQSFSRESAAGECEVAQRLASRLDLSEGAQQGVGACLERWDGKGMPRKLRGEAIPRAARLLNLASAMEIAHRTAGRESATALCRRQAGKAFDPDAAEAFLALAADDAFWAELDRDSLLDAVLAFEPATGRRAATDLLDRFVEALADLVDLKHPDGAGHSRRIAEVALRAAERLGIGDEQRASLQRAALLHDVGLVTVPAYVLQESHARTPSQQAAYRLHALRAVELLGHLEPLRPALDLVALHHERIDGRGYPGGVAGTALPREARVLAAACRADEVLRESGPEALGKQLTGEAAAGLDPEALGAVLEAMGARSVARATWPDTLTDREVEVLRLVARGLRTADIARELVVAESTARHHLEHIYAKIGVSSRAGATLYAVERGLLL